MVKKRTYTMPSDKIKIFECKLCKHRGIRKEVRKHIRDNHFWKMGKSLTDQTNVEEFK